MTNELPKSGTHIGKTVGHATRATESVVQAGSDLVGVLSVLSRPFSMARNSVNKGREIDELNQKNISIEYFEKAKQKVISEIKKVYDNSLNKSKQFNKSIKKVISVLIKSYKNLKCTKGKIWGHVCSDNEVMNIEEWENEIDDSNFRSKFSTIHETGVLEINSISSATNDNVMHNLINQKSEVFKIFLKEIKLEMERLDKLVEKVKEILKNTKEEIASMPSQEVTPSQAVTPPPSQAVTPPPQTVAQPSPVPAGGRRKHRTTRRVKKHKYTKKRKKNKNTKKNRKSQRKEKKY